MDGMHSSEDAPDLNIVKRTMPVNWVILGIAMGDAVPSSELGNVAS
jgi:hypothetical protein